MAQSVKNNQDAPLQRLPPKLRSRIWEYALGGKTLRYTPIRRVGDRLIERMVPPVSKRTHGIDLLRTCHQIYTETTLLPYITNTFAFMYYYRAQHNLKSLKAFQRAQVTTIQVEVK